MSLLKLAGLPDLTCARSKGGSRGIAGSMEKGGVRRGGGAPTIKVGRGALVGAQVAPDGRRGETCRVSQLLQRRPLEVEARIRLGAGGAGGDCKHLRDNGPKAAERNRQAEEQGEGGSKPDLLGLEGMVVLPGPEAAEFGMPQLLLAVQKQCSFDFAGAVTTMVTRWGHSVITQHLHTTSVR